MSRQRIAIPALQGMTVQAVSSFSILKVGDHLVSLAQVEILYDYQKLNLGKQVDGKFTIEDKAEFKENRAWVNDSVQVAVVFRNDQGQITEYFNLLGYVSPTDILQNPMLLNDPEFLRMNGLEKMAGKLKADMFKTVKRADESYSVIMRGTGDSKQAYRLINPEKTRIAHNILSGLLVSAGEEVGAEIMDSVYNIVDAVDEGTELFVKVTVGERILTDAVRGIMKDGSKRESILEVKKVRPASSTEVDHAQAPTASTEFDDFDEMIG